MGNAVNERSKDFLVSTADVAFLVNGQLAFTGTTSLNTSISVSMEDQEITGGKGNKTLYKYKYGRKLAPSIEMAEWNLAYIAANVGSTVFEGLKDVFAVAECVTLTNGVGTLNKVPTGKVFVEKADIEDYIDSMIIGMKVTEEYVSNMTIRKFWRYIKRINKHEEYNACRSGEMGGMVTFKEPIHHWMTSIDVDDEYENLKTDEDELRSKIE